MDNVANLYRPESTLSTDGVYVPTQEDWDEANAHWDAMEGGDQDSGEGAYDPFECEHATTR